jgi:hypothetical protein
MAVALVPPKELRINNAIISYWHPKPAREIEIFDWVMKCPLYARL